MRRNPEAAPAPLMVGRDGRLLPFDGSRLGRSLARALRDEGPDALEEADDLVDLVRARLGRRSGAGPATADEVGRLAAAVLDAAGHRTAARRYRRRLEASPERVRAQVRHLIADATDLPGRTAWDVAREVQTGLAASGLQGARPGLILEWVDHALRRRGLEADVSRRATVGVTDHELRAALARGAGGLPAELRAAQALLTRHALDHVLPAEVARAHDEGRLDLSDLMGGCRIPGLRLPPGRVAEGRPTAASAARLRSWAALTSHELAVPWVGPDPGRQGAEELLHQLELPGDTPSPVVLCIPARARTTARALAAARGALGAAGSLPRLRVHGPFESGQEELVELDEALELAAEGPRPGAVLAGVALNLVRPALEVERGDVSAYLDVLERTCDLAFSGCAASEALGPGRPAASQARAGLGGGARLEWSLRLTGLAGALGVLLSGGSAAPDHADDLVAAIGDRIQRSHGTWSRRMRGPERHLRIELAPPREVERLQALDAAAMPAAGPLCYDEVPAPGEAPDDLGRRAAFRRRVLGVAPDQPTPSVGATGSPEWRRQLTSAFLIAFSSQADVAPCA